MSTSNFISDENKYTLFPYGQIETEIKIDYPFLKKTLSKDFKKCYNYINKDETTYLDSITRFNKYIKDINGLYFLNNKLFNIDDNINLKIIETNFNPYSFLFYIKDNIKKILILIVNIRDIKIYINKEFYNNFINKENKKLYCRKYNSILSKIYNYYNINNFDNVSYTMNEETLIDTFRNDVINIHNKRCIYINNLEEGIIFKNNQYSNLLLNESNIISLLNNIFSKKKEDDIHEISKDNVPF